MSEPTAAQLFDLMPFAATLGVVAEVATAQEAVARLEWTPQRCTAGGLLHGGALVGLADCTAAVCAFLNLPKEATTATIAMQAQWFGAVRDGSVVATARPLHVGGSTIVVQTDLTHEPASGDPRRIAQVTQTQSVQRPAR